MKKYFYAIFLACLAMPVFSQVNLLRGDLLFLPTTEDHQELSLEMMNADIIEKLERRGAILNEEQKQRINRLNQQKKQNYLIAKKNILACLPQFEDWSANSIKEYCPEYSLLIRKSYQTCRKEQNTSTTTTKVEIQNCISAQLTDHPAAKDCILSLFDCNLQSFQSYQDWINKHYMPQLRAIIDDDEIVRRAFPRFSLK